MNKEVDREPEKRAERRKEFHQVLKPEISLSIRTFVWSKIADVVRTASVSPDGELVFTKKDGYNQGYLDQDRALFAELEQMMLGELSDYDLSRPPTLEQKAKIRKALVVAAFKENRDGPVVMRAWNNFIEVKARGMFRGYGCDWEDARQAVMIKLLHNQALQDHLIRCAENADHSLYQYCKDVIHNALIDVFNKIRKHQAVQANTVKSLSRNHDDEEYYDEDKSTPSAKDDKKRARDLKYTGYGEFIAAYIEYQRTCANLSNPRSEMGKKEVEQLFESALQSLTERQQKILVMKWGKGMSFEDIASTLGINCGAARTDSSRAWSKLSRHPAIKEVIKGMMR